MRPLKVRGLDRPGDEKEVIKTLRKNVVYGSFNRPISRLWATLPDHCTLWDTPHGDWRKLIPWTWLFCDEPLPAETIDRYELVHAFERTHYINPLDGNYLNMKETINERDHN